MQIGLPILRIRKKFLLEVAKTLKRVSKQTINFDDLDTVGLDLKRRSSDGKVVHLSCRIRYMATTTGILYPAINLRLPLFLASKLNLCTRCLRRVQRASLSWNSNKRKSNNNKLRALNIAGIRFAPDPNQSVFNLVLTLQLVTVVR